MSDSSFGNLFKRFSDLDKQFKDIDNKLEKFQKATIAYTDRIQNASENLVEQGGKKIDKFDKATRIVVKKIDERKKDEE